MSDPTYPRILWAEWASRGRRNPEPGDVRIVARSAGDLIVEWASADSMGDPVWIRSTPSAGAHERVFRRLTQAVLDAQEAPPPDPGLPTPEEALHAIHNWWCSLCHSASIPDLEHAQAAIALVRACLMPEAGKHRRRQVSEARAILAEVAS